MDFCWLNDLKGEFEALGSAPTQSEIIAMKASISIICEKYNHDVAHFWGKIKGTERNYLIVVCYTNGLLGERTVYGSLDGVTWFGLPLVTETLISHVVNIRDRIRGQPLAKSIVRHPRKPTAFVDLTPLVPPKPKKGEEEEEEEETKEPNGDDEEEEKEEDEELPEYEEFVLSEDQRIAVLVHLVDQRGLIFPQDALLWKSSTEVKINPLFKGIPEDCTLEDFSQLDKDIRGETARPNAIVDTMPPLTEDLPSRGWCISHETNSKVIKIFSRLWPGLVFIIKENKWGTVYLGDGQRNTDFLFASE